jgi:DNA-binding transcriptional MerR regulator
MNNEATYSVEELAEAFGLTPRTARHHIEKVLPPRHRTGRGRRARYGRDTWNCFAFIRRARQRKLTMTQIAGLLGSLGQARIDRVAQGLEELAIVPTAAEEPREYYSSPCMAGDFPEAGVAAGAARAMPRWQVLYSDDELQITHKGQASAEQRAQVRMAAAYIRRIFRQGD